MNAATIEKIRNSKDVLSAREHVRFVMRNLTTALGVEWTEESEKGADDLFDIVFNATIHTVSKLPQA